WHFDQQIEISAVANVDDSHWSLVAGLWLLVRGRVRCSGEEPCGFLYGMDGGGEADPERTLLTQRIEAGEREHEVTPALVAHEGVQLIDDDRAHIAQQCAAALGGQHEVERLRRGDEDVRRVAKDRSA